MRSREIPISIKLPEELIEEMDNYIRRSKRFRTRTEFILHAIRYKFLREWIREKGLEELECKMLIG